MDSKPLTVVVLGASKSGTSVTAGILHHLGVHMGSDLRPPDDRNPRGYFEDGDFLRLNDRILRSADGEAWIPPPLESVMAVGPQFEEGITSIIRARDEARTVWGWKVTTTCLTFGLFAPYLRSPRVVTVVRNPLDTARSAVEHRRGRIDLVEALRVMSVFQAAMFESLRRVPEIPVFIIDYTSLLREPGKAVDGLARFLGIEPTRAQRAAAQALVAGRKQIRVQKIAWRVLSRVKKLARGWA
jgi:hypothetical protein